jgi:hypothetical protein
MVPKDGDANCLHSGWEGGRSGGGGTNQGRCEEGYDLKGKLVETSVGTILCQRQIPWKGGESTFIVDAREIL